METSAEKLRLEFNSRGHTLRTLFIYLFLNRSFNHIICHRLQQAKLCSVNKERIWCSVYNWKKKKKHLKEKKTLEEKKYNHKDRAVCQTLLSRKYWYLILVFFMFLGWGSKFLFGQNSHSCLSLDFCLSRSDKNLPFCTPAWFSALSYKSKATVFSWIIFGTHYWV